MSPGDSHLLLSVATPLQEERAGWRLFHEEIHKKNCGFMDYEDPSCIPYHPCKWYISLHLPQHQPFMLVNIIHHTWMVWL